MTGSSLYGKAFRANTNSLFVPGIYLGVICDRQKYKGKEDTFAEDNLKWNITTATTIDFAITPAAQFRLAFPIQKSEFFNTNNKLNITVAVLQYNFKLFNLSDK